MKIVFTDLDGTLLNNQCKISSADFNTLEKLKRNNITVAAVTGRNLFSSKKVLTDNLPIDYLIFSTGVAIMDFKTKEILKSYKLTKTLTDSISAYLRMHKLNFFMHFPVPQNHNFFYNYVVEDSDFKERFEIYSDFSSVFPENLNGFRASQFVIVLPYDLARYTELRREIENKFPQVSIVRATSPLNNRHIWLEIYPNGVNKGSSCEKLCKIIGIDKKNTIAIGNDYNDEEMLKFAEMSFVVGNSPAELKNIYKTVADNNSSGFSEAVYKSGIIDNW